jgi:hypothetical protein
VLTILEFVVNSVLWPLHCAGVLKSLFDIDQRAALLFSFGVRITRIDRQRSNEKFRYADALG